MFYVRPFHNKVPFGNLKNNLWKSFSKFFNVWLLMKMKLTANTYSNQRKLTHFSEKNVFLDFYWKTFYELLFQV